MHNHPYPTWTSNFLTYINMNMRPQHITITSIKYLISYPINMKVSNQVFTTSNSNKCVVRARHNTKSNPYLITNFMVLLASLITYTNINTDL